jgi:hypothetical protein
MGLAIILAILVIAAGLVIVDLVRFARRELHKARVREAARARLREELTYDRVIHDRVRQQAREYLGDAEAKDYLTLMAEREIHPWASEETGNRHPYVLDL